MTTFKPGDVVERTNDSQGSGYMAIGTRHVVKISSAISLTFEGDEAAGYTDSWWDPECYKLIYRSPVYEWTAGAPSSFRVAIPETDAATVEHVEDLVDEIIRLREQLIEARTRARTNANLGYSDDEWNDMDACWRAEEAAERGEGT